MPEFSTTSEFIQKAILKHGLKYCYDKVIYVNSKTKIEIYCYDHKEYFRVTPNKHLNNRLGKGRGSVSESTKKLMSKNSKGISRGKGLKFTKTHKENISKSKKGCTYPNFATRKDKGISRTYHIEAVIEAKSKPILQFDKNNNFIQEFKSGKEASRILNLHQANINSCCNNKVKTCGGFIFKFKNH